MQPGAELRLGVLHVLRGVAVHRLRVGAHREQAVVAAVGIGAIGGAVTVTIPAHVGRAAAEDLRLSSDLQLAGLPGRQLGRNGDHCLAAGDGHRDAGLVLLARGSAQLLVLLLLLLEIAHGVGLSQVGARLLRGRFQGTLCGTEVILLLEVMQRHGSVHRRVAGTVPVLDAQGLRRLLNH